MLQGEQGETPADFRFLMGMDGAELADIHGRGHAAVGNDGEALLLCLIEIAAGPGLGVIVGIRCDLYEIEGGIRDLEFLTHHLDIGGLQADVLVGTPAVGLALVPEHALEGIGHEGMDLSVVKQARLLVLTPGVYLACLEMAIVKFTGEIAAYGLLIDPGLDRTAAPVGLQDADGDAEHVLEVFGEEIGRGAGVGDGFGGVDLPAFGRDGVLGGRDGAPDDLAHADGAVGAGADDQVRGALRRLGAVALDRHFHVGLAGAEPDFADEHIADRQLLAVADDDVIGAAGCGRGDAYGPLSGLGVGFDDGLLPGPAGLYGHFLPGTCGAPKGHGGLLLQDHIVSDEIGQLHLGGRRGAQQREREDEEKLFHGA